MFAELDGRIDGARIGLDALMRELETRHGRDRPHFQAFEHLPQLTGAFVAAVAAIGDDECGLSRPFAIEVVERVLQRRRIAPIILRRNEHEAVGFGHFSAPGASVLEDVVAEGRNAGLVVHGQRPVLQVHHFELCRNGGAADFGHPFRDLRTQAPRPRAADDDEHFISVYHTRNIGFLRGGVKVQNTRNLETLGGALVDLIGFLNSPQRDEALLREAGVDLDRGLFPLLVALGARGALGVAELADLVGRDHTTVSRQLAKLHSLRLVLRAVETSDRRRRAALLTDKGRNVVRAIALARRRLLSRVLAEWSESDRALLARLNRRFADALTEFASAGA